MQSQNSQWQAPVCNRGFSNQPLFNITIEWIHEMHAVTIVTHTILCVRLWPP